MRLTYQKRLFADEQPDIRENLHTVLLFTRHWIQYGVFGFTVACIMIGAVERLFGR